MRISMNTELFQRGLTEDKCLERLLNPAPRYPSLIDVLIWSAFFDEAPNCGSGGLESSLKCLQRSLPIVDEKRRPSRAMKTNEDALGLGDAMQKTAAAYSSFNSE